MPTFDEIIDQIESSSPKKSEFGFSQVPAFSVPTGSGDEIVEAPAAKSRLDQVFDLLDANVPAKGTANVPKFEAIPERGIIGEGLAAVRESLAPILGKTSETIEAEKVPITDAKGNVSYGYSPFSTRLEREGLFAPPVATEEVIRDIPFLAPQESDSGFVSGLRGLGRGTVGVLNSLQSPIAAPLLLSGGAEAAALKSAFRGVPTQFSRAILESPIPELNRVGAGAFGAAMVPTIPEQVSGLANSQNAGEAVERAIGLGATGLGVVGGGAIALRPHKIAQAKVALDANMPATAAVLAKQGIDLSKTRTDAPLSPETVQAFQPEGSLTPEVAAPAVSEGAPAIVPETQIQGEVNEPIPIVEQGRDTAVTQETQAAPEAQTQEVIPNELSKNTPDVAIPEGPARAQQTILDAIDLIQRPVERVEQAAGAADVQPPTPEQQLGQLEASLPKVTEESLSALQDRRTKTTEHDVYFDPESDRYVKVLQRGKFGLVPKLDSDGRVGIEKATLPEYLNRLRLTNEVFGTDIRIEGIARRADELDEDKFTSDLVISQSNIRPKDPENAEPTQDRINSFMREEGFSPVPGLHKWRRAEDGLLVADAKPDNFIETENGVVPIDLLISQEPVAEAAQPIAQNAITKEANQESLTIPEGQAQEGVPNASQVSQEGVLEPVLENEKPIRVRLGKSPQTFRVEEVLPRQNGDLPDETYYRVRNEKTGAEQVVEKRDLIPTKDSPEIPVEPQKFQNLGPGAANILEPLVSYEERQFGRRLLDDPDVPADIAANIDNLYYEPIPNKLTAEQAREYLNENGIESSINAVRNAPIGDLDFRSRVALGELVLKRLNKTYQTLRETNPQEAARVQDQAIGLSEYVMDLGTQLGQGVQAFSMWSRLTPDGLLRSYQRYVDKARSRYSEENGIDVGQILETVNTDASAEQKLVALKALLKTNNTLKKSKDKLKDIVEASRDNKLSDQEFYDIVQDRLGLPKYTPEIAEQIRQIAQKIDDSPEGISKDRAKFELAKFIAKQKGFRTADLPIGIFYGNILSGYNTHIVNFLDTLINVTSEINGLALANPRAAIKIYAALARGLSEGKADALLALTEGRVATQEKWMDIPRLLEVSEFGVKGGVPIEASGVAGKLMKRAAESRIALPLNAWKYVGRLMQAEDAISFRGAKEASSALEAFRMAQREGLSGEEATARMQEILGLNRSTEFLKQAKEEGFEGQTAKARAIELREQFRPDEISDRSSEFASEATYNHDPHGVLGILANGMSKMSEQLPALKLFVPFTRIVANVTNRGLNYTPYGFKRALLGYTKEQRPTGDARAAALARATMGTTGLALLGVLQSQGVIDIQGAGPSDPQKRKQLQAAGWKPNSIKIGDTYYNYTYNPLGLGLSVIGNMMDSYRYGELGSKDAATRGAYALSRIPSTVFSQSFLSGLSGLFGALSSDPGESLAAVKRTLSSTVGGLTYPQIFRDITRVFDPKSYKSDSIAGDLLRNTPFASLALYPDINAFGEEVEPPKQRFITTLKDDPAWRFVVSSGVRIPVPERTTPKVAGGVEPLSTKQYYDYTKESGQEMKKWILKNLPTLQSMTQEDAQDAITQRAREQNRRILARIRRSP